MTGEKNTFGIIGGYGQAGVVVAKELLRSTSGNILVGGRDIKKAQALCDELGARSFAHQVDIFRERTLDEFCRSCNVVINCAGPVSAVMDKVAEAALRHRCHYVDPGGYMAVFERLKAHQAEIQEARLIFLLSAGWIPGLSDVFVFYADAIASATMDEVESVHLYYGDRNEWSETGLRDIAWHTNHYVKDGLGVYRDGRWVKRSFLRSVRTVQLPAPLGRQRVFVHFSQQLHNFGRARTYREVSCYLTSMSLPTAVLMFFVSILLKHNETLAMRVVRAAFRKECQRHGRGGSLLVLVEGRKDGKRLLMTATLIENRHYWITGIVAATAARLISEKRITLTGSHFLCDSVDPLLFIEELGKLGVNFKHEIMVQSESVKPD